MTIIAIRPKRDVESFFKNTIDPPTSCDSKIPKEKRLLRNDCNMFPNISETQSLDINAINENIT